MKKCLFLTVLTLLGVLLPLRAQTIYDESVNGPASNDYQNPTSLGTLSLGSSIVNGSVNEVYTGNGNYTTYPDFYTFTIPTNDVITILSITDSGVNQWAWIGNTGYSSQLGFTTNATTGNLIQQWSLTSLGSGTYGTYIRDTANQGSNNTTPYSLTFHLTAIPEPNPCLLIMLGVICFWLTTIGPPYADQSSKRWFSNSLRIVIRIVARILFDDFPLKINQIPRSTG